MPSIFAKTLTSDTASQHLAEEHRRLEDIGAREAGFRSEEREVLEEGDREKLAGFRRRTATLTQELADERAMIEARIARLERELAAALEREETARRQAVVDRLAASYRGMPPLYAKWAKLAAEFAGVLRQLNDLHEDGDRCRRELDRFDEADRAAGTPQEPSWVARGDQAGGAEILSERDGSGDRLQHPRFADIELCDARGVTLWRKGVGSR